MRFLIESLVGLLFVTIVTSQYPTTTPVPILKQINRHNEDGSYSFGYEAADGSFKIETKQANGEIKGKYGFVDDLGQVREVEYGASKRGFEPSGTGINVPPSTITGNEVVNPNEPEDDGQYREDPSLYHTDPRFTNGEKYEPVPENRRPKPLPVRQQYQSVPQQQYQSAPQQQYQSAFQQQYQSAPQQQYQSAAPQQYQQERKQYQPTYQQAAPVSSYSNYQQYEPAQPAQPTSSQYQSYQPYKSKSSVSLKGSSYSVQY
ncbi:hypothetical protein HCN44_005162 [Aphidius gifuensis]|uniref:Cuticular protein n=1 Tax=Aphidius gifuensis TaxID=684658 RepID=A0A834XSU4_APHGI|nr:cAMP-dependent protein kinase catalytic subunit-like [Aphidius gifuensis]KAF7992818.1 hypothetical protein HCN44_005162 [Aphidius gifuensis]